MTHAQLKAKYRYIADRDRQVRAYHRYHANPGSRWTKLSMHLAGGECFRALDACHEVGPRC